LGAESIDELLGAHANTLQAPRHPLANRNPDAITMRLIVIKAARYTRGCARIWSGHEMKVKMRSRGVPRMADCTEQLASEQSITLLYRD